MIESASEQPASGSGIRTVLSGENMDAVSAMKCTPQNDDRGGAVARPAGRAPASRRRSRRRPGSPAADSCGRGSPPHARLRARDLPLELCDLGARKPPRPVGQIADLRQCHASRAAALGGASRQGLQDHRDVECWGAECVSAPREMQSIPVSPISLELLERGRRRLPRGAARPRYLRDRLRAAPPLSHVVEQHGARGAPAASASSISARRCCTSTLSVPASSGACWRAPVAPPS